MQYKDKILIVEGHAIFQLWFFSLVQCKKYLLNVYNATVFSAWMQSVLNLFEWFFFLLPFSLHLHD